MPTLFRKRHFFAASTLHVLLIALLVLGVQCSPKIQKPAVIEAVVITGKNKAGEVKLEAPRAEPKPEPKPEPPKPAVEPPKPEPKPEPPKPDPAVERKKLEEQQKKIEEQKKLEQKRKEEQEEKKKIEEARKQKEKEERERVELERKKAREEEERKKQEEAQRKAEEEAKRKAEEEARRKAEEEAKRKAAEEARRKAQEEREMREAFERSMNDEAAARAEAAYIAQVQRTWADDLIDHIRPNWLRPPGLPDSLKCQVQVELLPNGEVVSVRVINPSGNPSFDDSVLRAVLKSSPLPLPKDPKAFERILRPTFTPKMFD
jgi:colicin import membrane protein